MLIWLYVLNRYRFLYHSLLFLQILKHYHSYQMVLLFPLILHELFFYLCLLLFEVFAVLFHKLIDFLLFLIFRFHKKHKSYYNLLEMIRRYLFRNRETLIRILSCFHLLIQIDIYWHSCLAVLLTFLFYRKRKLVLVFLLLLGHIIKWFYSSFI